MPGVTVVLPAFGCGCDSDGGSDQTESAGQSGGGATGGETTAGSSGSATGGAAGTGGEACDGFLADPPASCCDTVVVMQPAKDGHRDGLARVGIDPLRLRDRDTLVQPLVRAHRIAPLHGTVWQWS